MGEGNKIRTMEKNTKREYNKNRRKQKYVEEKYNKEIEQKDFEFIYNIYSTW